MAGSNAPAGKSGNLLGLKIALAVILFGVAGFFSYRALTAEPEVPQPNLSAEIPPPPPAKSETTPPPATPAAAPNSEIQSTIRGPGRLIGPK